MISNLQQTWLLVLGQITNLLDCYFFIWQLDSAVPPVWCAFTAMSSNLHSGEVWHWKSCNILNWNLRNHAYLWCGLDYFLLSTNWSCIWRMSLTHVFIQNALMHMSIYVHRVQINMYWLWWAWQKCLANECQNYKTTDPPKICWRKNSTWYISVGYWICQLNQDLTLLLQAVMLKYTTCIGCPLCFTSTNYQPIELLL